MKDSLGEVSFPLRRASTFGFLTKTESRGLWIQAPFLSKVNSLGDRLGKPPKEYVVSQPLSEFQDSKESGLPTDDFLLNMGRVLLSNHVHGFAKNLWIFYLVNYSSDTRKPTTSEYRKPSPKIAGTQKIGSVRGEHASRWSRDVPSVRISLAAG